MVGMEAQIADTLRQPHLVRKSCSDGSVEYLPDDAFVMTAYLTDKPKKGEDL
jgi:hypothetical protein